MGFKSVSLSLITFLMLDILILPYGLKQKVEFKKNVGPILGDLNLDQAFEVTENDFIERVDPVYKAINLVRNNNLTAVSYTHLTLPTT